MNTYENLPVPPGPVREEVHNTQINTAAAQAHRCGMTHLPTGRICLLPERHSGSCDFQHRQSDIESATS
jgi:hypothetical protein